MLAFLVLYLIHVCGPVLGAPLEFALWASTPFEPELLPGCHRWQFFSSRVCHFKTKPLTRSHKLNGGYYKSPSPEEILPHSSARKCSQHVSQSPSLRGKNFLALF